MRRIKRLRQERDDWRRWFHDSNAALGYLIGAIDPPPLTGTFDGRCTIEYVDGNNEEHAFSFGNDSDLAAALSHLGALINPK